MTSVIRAKSYDPIASTGLMSDADIMKFVSIFMVGIESHHRLVLDHSLLMMKTNPMRDKN